MQAYLILANGRVFRGQSIGCPGTTIGEVVFATGMVGFEETLTDPSYYGQIITQTYPLIGNYGMNSEDVESGKIWAKGYIVRETDPDNRRRTRIALTEKGEEVRQKGCKLCGDYFDRIVARMGEEKMLQFLSLWKELVEIMESNRR